MHELALTEGIINILNSQQEREGFSRVLEIRLRVGEYSGVVPDCIREFFPIAAKGTAAEEAGLVIEPVEAAFRCQSCGYEGKIERKSACCPACGSTAVRLTAGREFYVENITVE